MFTDIRKKVYLQIGMSILKGGVLPQTNWNSWPPIEAFEIAEKFRKSER